MNALRLLMSHHDRIEGLLVDLSQADEAAREPLYRELVRVTERHLDVEENLFYTAVAPRLILVKADPFLAEHKDIREALHRVEGALHAPDYAQQLQDLHDDVVRHISDEEIELLAEVKRRFSVDELDELGDRLDEATRAGGAIEQPAEERLAEPAEDVTEEEAEGQAEEEERPR